MNILLRHSRALAFIAIAAVAGATAPASRAHEDKPPAHEPGATKTGTAAQAKAACPLATCVVSDEELDHVGTSVEYFYQPAGQPDRLVIFCCKDCIADFEKEPAKYLAKLDEAAAAKAKPAAKK